ncbi:cysteine-rich receptor-like protein kinase 37 [Zingiber officinale]|uniref:cysteine-rich receptor-like protein kinase 37 n=1 Tax=Zingiber officinale TaxID=94328 RepID=UPI001C4CD4DB|nr:cysteine-rich receptor-like protein kinase 37 [Zingiber officinale]
MTDERSSIGSSQEAPQIYRFNLEEIECATQYFSEVNLLSKKSSFAATYKGILHDGTEVAVKRINKTSCKSEEAEFLMGLKALTLLRHENLVGLRGFCYSRARGECFLIYDFVANGSLSEYLDVKCDEIHKVLDWSVRVCIIKGIAKGILLDLYDYLFSFSDSYHNEYTTVTTTATNIDHLRWNFILSFNYICTLP